MNSCNYPLERPTPHTLQWRNAIQDSGIRGWSLMEKMGYPKKIVAPMVDQSELAFRLLCRKYGAELCYTPMINSKVLLNNIGYQRMILDIGNPEDRPLFVQLCGNDPEIMTKAGKLVEKECDAIDINLGCPQNIARKGNYGSFLLEKWDLVQEIIWSMHCNVAVPITCKIRLLDSIEDTVTLCKLLAGAGCCIIAVHGRTKSQVGSCAGTADWEKIRIIREAIPVPIIANGGISSIDDFRNCLDTTGAAGVMVAESILCNPAMFYLDDKGCYKKINLRTLAFDYLELVRKYPPKRYVAGTIRGHLFKMLYMSISRCADLRESLASTQSVDEIEKVCCQILERSGDMIHNNFMFAWYFRHRKHVIPHVDPSTTQKGGIDYYFIKNRKHVEPPIHDTEAITSLFNDESTN